MFDTIKRKAQRIAQDHKRDDMIIKMARLKALIGEKHKSGWEAYDALIRGYINAQKEKKARTRIDIVKEEEILELRLLDREIFILNWLLDIPHQYIERAEHTLENERRRTERENLSQKA